MNEKQLDLDEISQTSMKPHYSSQSILSVAAAHLPKSALILHPYPTCMLAGPCPKDRGRGWSSGPSAGHRGQEEASFTLVFLHLCS